MKIAIFFNNNRGLKTLNYLIKKKKYIIDIYLTRKNLNSKILNKIKKKFFIIKKIDLKIISKIKKNNYDLLITAGWPLIFPQALIKASKFGTINLHASLLPNYRGAAPINWCLINNEVKTGVTTFFINEKIDQGDILLKEEVNISDKDNFGSLYIKLSSVGSRLLIKTIKGVLSKSLKASKQDFDESLIIFLYPV